MSLLKNSILLPTIYFLVWISLCNCEAPFQQDTYLNALQTSHNSDDDTNTDFTGYNYNPPANNQYLPPSNTPSYAPAPVYGPPAPIYGPPQQHYYKPLPLPYHSRDHLSLLEKLKTKINLFTIGKIILKLLIFKKIVKFIGLICLLLFLPKLKGLFKEDMSMDEDAADSKTVRTEKDDLNDRIEELYEFVVKSFSKFGKE